MAAAAESPLSEFITAAQKGDRDATLAAARRDYARFLSGDLSLDDPVIDPEMKWIPPKHAPTAGTYTGAAQAEEEVQAWTEPFDDFRWEPKEIVFGQSCFVVIGDMGGRGKASGLEAQMEETHVWTLREGRVVRLEMFLDRGEALAAAGLTQAG